MKSDPSILSRRKMIFTSAGALAGLCVSPFVFGKSSANLRQPRIPLLHITDLYHPPQDPDDLLDLLTVAALGEFDLNAVVLDVTRKFLEPAPSGFDIARDPGFTPVARLAHLLGRTIPVASGPIVALKSTNDTSADRPADEQTGIAMILEILSRSIEPVLISCVGSARVVTAAFNREPELLRSKVKAVVLNAGSTGGRKQEWNVGLDPAAYAGLWNSGLPIHWYPCATERSAFNPDHNRGTYWKTTHADLFRDFPPRLRSWIAYHFIAVKGETPRRALPQDVPDSLWETVCQGERNMWSTASLVMAAGRVLAHTGSGWRFIAAGEADGLEVWPWRLDTITATADDEGWIKWSIDADKGPYRLFWRKGGSAFGAAMTEALNALLRSMAV